MLLLLDNMDWKSTLPVMYFEQSGNIFIFVRLTVFSSDCISIFWSYLR